MSVAVEMGKSGTEPSETNSRSRIRRWRLSYSDAVVLDDEPKSAVRPFSENPHRSSGLSRTDAVTDCIFHDRLKDELRHERLSSVIGRSKADGQAVVEAGALNRQVLVDEPQLFVEPDLGPRVGS